MWAAVTAATATHTHTHTHTHTQHQPAPTCRLKPFVFERWSTTRPGVPTITCGRLASAMAWRCGCGCGCGCGVARARQFRWCVTSWRTQAHTHAAAHAALRRGRRPHAPPPAHTHAPAHLRHHVDAADQHRRLEADASAQRLKLLGDLDGQLARGRQHQRIQLLRRVQQALQDGQRKRARLAGACLGEADDVVAWCAVSCGGLCGAEAC
jgi:hypothetical protein